MGLDGSWIPKFLWIKGKTKNKKGKTGRGEEVAGRYKKKTQGKKPGNVGMHLEGSEGHHWWKTWVCGIGKSGKPTPSHGIESFSSRECGSWRRESGRSRAGVPSSELRLLQQRRAQKTAGKGRKIPFGIVTGWVIPRECQRWDWAEEQRSKGFAAAIPEGFCRHWKGKNLPGKGKNFPKNGEKSAWKRKKNLSEKRGKSAWKGEKFSQKWGKVCLEREKKIIKGRKVCLVREKKNLSEKREKSAWREEKNVFEKVKNLPEKGKIVPEKGGNGL